MSQSLRSIEPELVAILMSVAMGTVAADARAASSPRGAWQAPRQNAQPLPRQLGMSLGITWRQLPLRRALAGLAQNQRVSIFLDRRVDPDQQIDFSASDVSLEQALEKLAAQLELGLAYVGPVVYIGPTEVTANLAAIVQQLNQRVAELPRLGRPRWQRRQPWSWPELSEPRQLMDELARTARVEVQNVNQLPHDLWPAADLPPMTLVERLTLLLAGFQLTFEINAKGDSIRLTAIADRVTLQRSFPVSGQITVVAQQLSQQFPECRIQTDGSQIRVVGTWEELKKIGQLLSGQPEQRAPQKSERKRYTLRVENQPARELVRALATRLALRIELAPSLPQLPSDLVTVRVRDATADELLEAALRPVGLTHQIRGDTLFISDR